jgi:hypothetical protein
MTEPSQSRYQRQSAISNVRHPVAVGSEAIDMSYLAAQRHPGLSTTVPGTMGLDWTIAETGDYIGNSDTLWTDRAGDVATSFVNGITVSPP